MINKFDTFMTSISHIHKNIRKIKDKKMKSYSLKGSHVMCLFYLMQNPEGLTMSELNDLCVEDKAATSRTVAYLKENGYISHELNKNEKNYNSRIYLLKKGREVSETFEDIIAPIVNIAEKSFTKEEQLVFTKLLAKVAENLGEYAKTL